jgi:hypothetical protein
MVCDRCLCWGGTLVPVIRALLRPPQHPAHLLPMTEVILVFCRRCMITRRCSSGQVTRRGACKVLLHLVRTTRYFFISLLHVVIVARVPLTYTYANVCMCVLNPGLGLFPDGFGPTGFLPSRPTLVPIHAQKEEDDDLLDSRKAHCHKRVKADSKIWLAQVGLMMMESNRHAIQSMSCLCGTAFFFLPSHWFSRTVAFLTARDVVV